jgi:acylpyruvate hydrolase
MRLSSYRDGSGWRAGIGVDQWLVDAGDAAEAAPGVDAASCARVRDLIALAPDMLRELDGAAVTIADRVGMPLGEVVLGPPVPDPDKVICVGLNYLEHQKESVDHVEAAQALPRYPLLFTKFASSLIGPGQPIDPPAATDQLDYEAELAAVIGRTACDVKLGDALGHVAGYMPFNDVSARDLQRRSAQWTMGKAFDTSGPCGPFLVTADEIGDPQDLMLTGRLNGEVMQRSSTALMIFSVAQLVEYIAQAITLVPGDIIVTGTPGGVGMARQPQVYLRPGDVYEVEIERIGTLTTPVGEPTSAFVSRLESYEDPA